MITSDAGGASHQPVQIGHWHGIEFDVDTRSPLEFPAEFCVIGLFTQQANGRPLSGALHLLDRALTGALEAVRSDGLFHAKEGDTMLLSSLPATIAARAVLLIGLGDADAWTPSVTGVAAAVAMREALRLGMASVFFAPLLQDSGIGPERTAGTAATIFANVLRVLKMHEQDRQEGFSLRRWTFSAGLEWKDITPDLLRDAARNILT
ncbi:MAG: hypothetical protein CMN72_03885 [Sphingomonas sp.]|nr:hypothetical protein [Sphingomonas sp.]